MNGYLKEMAVPCGINKPLTTHIARSTFATTVALSNGVPIETVSKMLGHTCKYPIFGIGLIEHEFQILEDSSCGSLNLNQIGY